MKIVNYPHPALRFKARPISNIDKELQRLADQMLELMYLHKGLGLAAPQVGVPCQLLVMNFAGEANEKDKEYVAINPVITEQKGTIEDREGCLSFPDLYQKIRRSRTVTVRAYNLQGQLYEMTVSELPARIWQHEIDHLDGTLFIDKMGPLARFASRSMLEDFVAKHQKAQQKGDLPTDPDIEKRLHEWATQFEAGQTPPLL